jgi:cytosine/adenosine deaminase-related metal-dependent hydrolase
MDDILIKDALIVTCDGTHSIIENGVMAVNQGKITALEPSDTLAAKNLTAKKNNLSKWQYSNARFNKYALSCCR